MAFNGSQHFRIPRPIVQPDFGAEQSISGHLTLTDKDSTYQFVTNTISSTLDVILPAFTKGLKFVIKNQGGANNITVMDPTSSVLETLALMESCTAIGFAAKYLTIKN